MTEVKEFKPIVQDNKFLKKLESLTKKEKKYFALMRQQFLVPYIKAKPGVGKTSIFRTIAKKLGLKFEVKILSMIDETDLQFPYTEHDEDINMRVSNYAPPAWAVNANKQPTLILFDELNRAPLEKRNAALTMFLDRQIGEFKFNDNVFFVACGNLGEEDDTDVDVFDSALNNRLIHIDHYLELQEWLEWADGKIHPDVTAFLDNNSEVLTTKPTEDEGSNSGAYATPRTWEGVSKFIVCNFGGGPKLDREGNIIVDADNEPIIFADGFETDKKGNVKTYNDIKNNKSITKGIRNWGKLSDYKDTLTSVLPGIVGSQAASKFIRYLEDRVKLTLDDILNDFTKNKSVLKVLKSFKNDKYFELISEAKNAIIPKWTSKQSDNFVEFLKVCNPETRLGFILDLLDQAGNRFSEHVKDPIKNPPVLNILNSFRDELSRIKDLNESNRND